MKRVLRSMTLALTVPLWACNNSSESNPGDAPPLPSANSMRADFSLFEQTVVSNTAAATIGGANFLAAAFSVSVANAVTTLVMAVPVATFAAAASQDPVFEHGAFRWRYSTVVNGQCFAANLSGQGSGWNSLWEMRISASDANPPLNDFVYCSGSAALNGESGTWHVFEAAEQSAS